MEQNQERVSNQYNESGMERISQCVWICTRFLAALGMTHTRSQVGGGRKCGGASTRFLAMLETAAFSASV